MYRSMVGLCLVALRNKNSNNIAKNINWYPLNWCVSLKKWTNKDLRVMNACYSNYECDPYSCFYTCSASLWLKWIDIFISSISDQISYYFLFHAEIFYASEAVQRSPVTLWLLQEFNLGINFLHHCFWNQVTQHPLSTKSGSIWLKDQGEIVLYLIPSIS